MGRRFWINVWLCQFTLSTVVRMYYKHWVSIQCTSMVLFPEKPVRTKKYKANLMADVLEHI